MRRKIANLSSLIIIQGSNAIFPLVVFPFALSVVGPEFYSRIALTEAMSLFLLALVLYSFEIDGVASVVGLNPALDARRISGVVSRVVCARLLLFAAGAPLTLFIAWAVDARLLPAMFCWLMVPLGYALQPNWLCQGLEMNVPVAVVMAATRIAALLFVLTALHDGRDYLLVPLAIGGSSLLGASASLLYTLWRLKLKLYRPRMAELVQSLIYGRDVFFANFCVGLYRDANVLILNALGSSEGAIAAYSLAEKLVKVLQAAIRPLNQFYFPQAVAIAKRALRPGPAAFRALGRITWRQVTILFSALILVAVAYPLLADRLPWIGTLENRDRIAVLASMMCLASLFGVGNFVLGMAGLSNLGERRQLLYAMAGTGVANLLFCGILSTLFSDFGAAVSFSLSEVLLFLLIVRRYFRQSDLPVRGV